MAKPDTDDGWFKKAVELEAALGFADFSKVARTLLRYVFTQIYGRGVRPKLAHLPQKTIADRIGQQKQNVSRGIKELVESKVLIHVRDDHYRFVKDYEKWVGWSRSEGALKSPRLTPKEVADCKEAPRYADGFRAQGSVDAIDPTESSNGITRSSNGITGSNPVGLLQSSNGITGSNPVGLLQSSNGITGAIEERPRVQRDLERKREREGEREILPPPPKNFPLIQNEETDPRWESFSRSVAEMEIKPVHTKARS